jgi:glycosyltransferase involved in cell wall biosynthesis
VEWFGARFPGAPTEETLQGVHIVRGGRQWTVHWSAYRHYRGRLSQSFDVVVDQVNTIPFFTPLWADVPQVMLIHQLAREVWWYESPFPMSLIGYVAEPLYLRLYQNVPAMTVSASTKDDLRRLGFKASIVIIPQGLEPISKPAAARAGQPRFLYVGRLAPSKRVSDVIRAFAMFSKSSPDAELRLIGDGPPAYLRKLETLAHDLVVSENVHFLGRVSSEDKHRDMASAHALLLASAREGWGLVVTEANALGTPAIAYDVPGLRDSVRNEDTGLLVNQSPRSLADAMARLMTDQALYQRLSTAAAAWSATFSYESTTTAFRNELAGIVRERQPA